MRIMTKGLIGLEDINIGTSTFTRATSVGGTITLTKLIQTILAAAFPINSSSPLAPSGVINGSNAIFTLPTEPGLVVMVFRNGVLQRGGGLDYTLSGSTIRFTTAPAIGDTVFVVY